MGQVEWNDLEFGSEGEMGIPKSFQSERSY